MPKTVAGEQITWKEFGARWKKGIEGITPLQQVKAQLNGTKVMLLGMFLGFIISLINYNTLWWVAIILFGGIINTGVQHLGLKQKYIAFKKLDQTFSEFKKEGV